MLAEDRLEKIVALVNEHGSITATDLMQLLDASESTIRRDLTRLAQMGRIVKVHGGATAVTRTVVSSDQTVYEKYSVHLEEKTAIARFAATLIGPDDFVYIDAGSTTERLVDFITETRATYFTNSISVAHALLSRGCRVLVPAGELKPVTEALVGEQTVDTLRRYHFTIGFFGTNGATPDEGFTTPETGEALVKATALTQTLRPYVLCDSSKFSMVSPVTFADFDDATVVTDVLPADLEEYANIIVASAAE
ncbi:DeoR/GlpR family DNA-binding transcription regulator [Collinsella tanakaei]|uniref:DeoR/GlpR family DNA-binding transcription regulator n=1 Tax=Collinsella tanakaei TaxID=626935 RepID=UPI0025A37FE8|nr:DeoR/GlpR family DNA-binding transcription regulator [Collinsella tanakaei]MDM8246926.1 DeoR/GlpR family DNA-binding transcription regulator [Collinsella tanakaei]